MVEMESEAEVENDTLAILQLHSWGGSPLPVAALSEAAISPSRQLLLLHSAKDRDIVLLPLLSPSSNVTHNNSSFPDPAAYQFQSRNLSAAPSTPTTPITAAGHRTRTTTTSSPASASTPYATPFGGTSPISPRSAAFASICKARGNPVFESPTTPYFTPSFNPSRTSDSSSGLGAASPSDLSALPYPILSDVDAFAWGSNGDSFGSEGSGLNGHFKEILLTSGSEGFVFHCFSHRYSADSGSSVSSGSSSGGGLSNGVTGRERKRREGRWRNWSQPEQETRVELRKRLDETTSEKRETEEKSVGEGGDERGGGSGELKLERGKRKQRPLVESTGEDGEEFIRRNGSQGTEQKKEFISYVIDNEVELAQDGLQLKFSGAQTWPSSAEIVSFKIAKGSPAYCLLTSLKTPDQLCKENVGTTTESSAEDVEKPVASEVLPEITDIISSPSYNIFGIVAGQLLQSGEMSVEEKGEKSANGEPTSHKRNKYRDMRELFICFGVVYDWGIKTVARIDLSKGITKEANRIPWASFTFASDRLLGLKEDGQVFVWTAMSGHLVAYIDVVDHCGLRPPVSSPSRNGNAVNGERIEREQNGHNREGEAETSSATEVGTTTSYRADRKFTEIVVTANSLLLAVSDNKGVLYLVSTDAYFAQRTPCLPNQQQSYDLQDLRFMSYWQLGGSDIGSPVSTHGIPDRHWLNPGKTVKDGDLLGRGGHVQQRMSGKESGPGPPLSSRDEAISKVYHSASGFSPTVKLRRHGGEMASISESAAVKSPVRRIFLPGQRCESPLAMALNAYGVTALVRPVDESGQVFTISQNSLRIAGGALDERDLCQREKKKFETRSTYVGETLAFCSQGCLYLVTATALHVVLPPMALSLSKSAPSSLELQEPEWSTICGSETPSGWNKLNRGVKDYPTVIHHWQSEVLDRALVWDGLEEAEVLCLENGWSLRLLRLRRLQLALDFVRAEEIEQALEALVHVGAADQGVLYVIFAAVELMLNKHGSDNELAQASRLLSLAASFTTKLVRQHGTKGWNHAREQPQMSADRGSYVTTVGLVELARFLEVIRNLQERLDTRRRGPNRKKGDLPSVEVVVLPVDGRPGLESIDEGNEDGPQGQEGSYDRKELVASDQNVGQQDLSLLSLSASPGAVVPAGGVWELSPSGSEGPRPRRSSPIESPGEMFARWERDNVDAYGIVRDALKASGRLALAVAQLHRIRRKAAQSEGSQDQPSNSDDDVFAELLHIGRGIVYELLCKGKTGVALAALRRLGEDIDIALRELALGTVRRFLRAQVVKELQRLRCLSASDFQLLERVSLTERIYPSSSFWSTYRARQQLLRSLSESDESSPVDEDVELLLLLDMGADDGLAVKCGEVDGVVLGAWSLIDEPGVLEDVAQTPESSSTGYWAAAAVWLQHWDQLTFDRILLEQPPITGHLMSWEARLEFNIAHHNWEAVASLLDTVPSYVLREGELHIQLDFDDTDSDTNLPFPGIPTYTGHAGQDWSDLDVEAVEAVVPKVHVLALDITPICSTWMWHMIEERLVKNHIFLRSYWKGTLEIMSLFARAGLLYHRYGGRVSSSRSKDGTLSGPTKGSRLHKDSVRAIHELVVQHCVRHNLPNMLELYLDHHSLALDKGSASVMQALVGDCQWALWLLYSRLQRREYDASFANARTILAPSQSPRRRFEVSDLDVFLPTVDDMAEAGGEIMALATLMYAPVPVQKCLCAGSVSRHSGPSWQCTLENLQPGLQRFPTLWRSLVVTCFGHDPRGSLGGTSLTAGIGGSAEYPNWREGLFSSASGDTSLLQMMPRWLPQRVRRLLQLAVQGPAGGVQQALQRGGSEGLSRGPSGEKFQAAELNLLESQAASWEQTVQKAIEEELYAPSTEDTGLGTEHHLRRGRALAAFNSLLSSRVQSGANASQDSTGRAGLSQLTSSEIQSLLGPLTAHEEKLLATVAPLAITNYENPVIVAACAFFLELCGLSANLLRLDVAALKRISEYCKVHDQTEAAVPPGGGAAATRENTTWTKAYGAEMASMLAQALADEYLNAGVEMLSSKADGRSRRPNKTLMTLLQYLEKASLKDESMKSPDGSTPGSWLVSGQGVGSQLRKKQRELSERWSLVTAFCRAHHLPLSTVYLAALARDNDWVGFLAEAQLEGCSLDTLRTVVAKEFTDARLQSHLLTLLKSLPGATLDKSTDQTPGTSSVLPPYGGPVTDIGTAGELFSLLADCEHGKRPGKALLMKAKDLRWPLLAVVASCFNDVTPLSCLTVWLEITAARETSAIQVSDAAAQISGRVGAAVEATNALASSSRTSGFRFSRTCTKRRRRMSPEEENAQPEGQQSQVEEVTSTTAATGSDSHPSPIGSKQSTIGQRGQVTGAINTDGAGEHESLAAMVAVLCEQQRFLPLLRAFELFTPASSFLPFLRFLQAFSQMRISEASAHLAAFTALLKEETHQQNTSSSRSTKSNYTAWITKAAVAAADAMHAACPSAYERRCLLQLLSGSDFGDGGAAAMRFRRLYWKIQLAEPALREGSELVTDGTSLDDEGLLDALEKSGQWEQARSWARQLDLSSGGSYLHHVTETQAEAMVTEWKELLWDVPEERVALWNHCQALFTMHAFPAIRAGKFFLKHADAVEAEVSSTELHNILLLALQWLSGSITNTSPVYPLHLLHELETRVWLLAVESSVENQDVKDSTSLVSMQSTPVGGLSHEISATTPAAVNPVDRTAMAVAVVDSHLKRSNMRKMDAEGLVRAQSADAATGSSPTRAGTSKFKRRAKEQAQVKRIQVDLSESIASDSDGSPEKAALESKNGNQVPTADDIISLKVDDVVGSWEEKVGEREVERAVLALLEVGQVSAAKQLQQKLSPGHVPLELSLVEAALQVAALSTPTTKGAVTTSVIQPTIVEYLQAEKLLEDLASVTPTQVLEVLMNGCREGCGRGLIRRISAVAQIANFLQMPFSEAYAKQPAQLLQLLALKGQDALEEAKVLVANHTMIPASIARILAESFLKGLLAAHRGGYMDSEPREEGPAPLLWRPADFLRWAKLCPSEPEIGHALMRLVISGRDMPHACEVELIILAHQYYESSACLDGVDVLVALAATRVESYVSEGDFSSLARLVTGISNFQALRFILDVLIENGQLKLLLQKRSVVDSVLESSASVRGFRMAVLSALKLFNPHDLDAFAMVYSNFSMAHEMADLLESRGQKLLSEWNHKMMSFDDTDLGYDARTLDMMRYFVEAAEVYSGIDAGNKTRWCCAQAQLISLQLRMPETQFLNLSDTNARRLLVEQSRFQESLIVAEAYRLNESDEWVQVIWNQMAMPGSIDQFLNEFVASLPLTHTMLAELAKYYRAEVTAREGSQSELYLSRWLPAMPPEPSRLTKSFKSLLKLVRDVKDRLQLATAATGIPDVVDECLHTLDHMPVTAGPLILRKGHGGAYLPMM